MSLPGALLLVDDDRSLLEMLSSQLYGLEVVTAASGSEAVRRASERVVDAVVLDLSLPDVHGLELLPELRSATGDAPVIVVTGHYDMQSTIRAMKAGAFDYLHKPLPSLEALSLVLERALAVRALARKTSALQLAPPVPVKMDDVVGSTPAMQRLVKDIGKVAASRATVLIQGESGTGKELIARVIHAYSDDEARPFVGINCSAIVDALLESELFGHEKGAFTGASSAKPGKFEVAEDGTVFLDEIGDLSPQLQAKLLRVLQEREFERVGGVRSLPVRARVVAATHRDLAAEVAAGRFREDLYQRLKVITLELPPLRERRADIPALVHHLLHRINEKVHKRVTRVPPDVMELLQALPWRGNVRELENVLTRAVVLSHGEVLSAEHLPRPAPVSGGMQLDWLAVTTDEDAPIPTLEEAERRLILRALKATGGHKGRTCDLLGISRPTLERKLQKFQLSGSGPLERSVQPGGPR
jgi:two-component system response regulator AtoC